MNRLLTLLNDYEENEKDIFEYLQSDKQNMIEFLRLVVETSSDLHPKYPFIVSELLYGSYDQLLQMMFNWEGEPIIYLLTFSDYPQNETSCGYFEQCIRPLILLKSTEIKPYLNITKLLPLVQQESIQNVYITLLDCSNYEDQYKQDLIHIFLYHIKSQQELQQSMNPELSDSIFRIILKEQEQFQKYIISHQDMVDFICNKCAITYNQLGIIEYLIEWNQENLIWLHYQLNALKQIVPENVEKDQNINGMNFLYSSQVLTENYLKIIKIISLTISRPETAQFQEILLELLVKFEWNNSLQIIASNMYQELSKNDTPHSQYFVSIINEFIIKKVDFQLHDFGLKNKVARGYRWVFTKIVMLFQLNFPLAQEINTTEQLFLLNEDPSNARERQSFNILEKASERRLLWTKRIQEEEPLQMQNEECQLQQKQEMEQESEDNEQYMFQARNSFGIKPPILMENGNDDQKGDENQNQDINQNEKEKETENANNNEELPIFRIRSSCQFMQFEEDKYNF